MSNKTLTIYDLSKELNLTDNQIFEYCKKLNIQLNTRRIISETQAQNIKNLHKKQELQPLEKTQSQLMLHKKPSKPMLLKPLRSRTQPKIPSLSTETKTIEQFDNLENINIISVSKNTYISKYIPFISFEDNEQKQKGNYYILRTVENFFRTIQVTIPNLISSYLDYSKLITDLDFNDYKNVNISYFYDKLFFDLGDRDENNKLITPIKWIITFDINCTPIKIPELIIPNSGNLCRHFGTIDVGGTPILYYIYFTMQEILDAIRDSD